MFRLLLISILVAGVVSPAAEAAKASSAKVTKKKKQKRKAKDNRTPTKSTKANMPRGFVWPPNRTMEAMADECQAKLDEQGIAYEPAEAKGRVLRPMLPQAELGGITYTAVYSKNQVFDCQLVLALATFSPQLYDLGVREVRFGSAFRWSKVRVGGKTKNILSRHALGIAMDIVSFVDDQGVDHNVKHDYKAGDELLHDIERTVNDSGQFRLLLTPKNDPKSHSDHFHLEANPDYTAEVTPRPSS
ncbi:MAG: hypothetical protein HOV81_12240 [Kofleriaceae bacterium]|nr:hypothetical protein [Kofleriaceae bacterium]